MSNVDHHWLAAFITVPTFEFPSCFDSSEREGGEEGNT